MYKNISETTFVEKTSEREENVKQMEITYHWQWMQFI